MTANKKYQKMSKKDGEEMYYIMVAKILNASSAIQNLICSSVQLVCSLLYIQIQGQDYNLSEYYEAFRNHHWNTEKKIIVC